MKRGLVMLAVVAFAAAAGAQPKTVTLDVKDADLREVLQSMQKQCDIRNLVVDKEVAGAATLYFTEVPCETAFRVVFSQFGLAGSFEPAIVTVGIRRD